MKGVPSAGKEKEEALRAQMEALAKVQGELEECRNRYADLYDFAPVGYATFGRTGRIAEINLRGVALLGVPREQVLHTPLAMYLTQGDVAAFTRHLREVGKAAGQVAVELELRSTGNGRGTPVLLVTRRAQTAPGAEALYRTVLTDVSETRRAREALVRSEEFFRQAIVGAPIPIIVVADNGEVLGVSEAFAESTGYTQADLPTLRAWCAKAYVERAGEMEAAIMGLFELTTATRGVETIVTTRSGERRTWAFANSPPGALSDGRRFIVGMAEDVTERKVAEARLKEANQLLAGRVHEQTRTLRETNRKLRRTVAERDRLEKAVIEIRDDEQQRISHDLHDGLGQHLTGVAFLASALEQQLAASLEPEAATRAGQIAGLVNRAISQVREIAHGLNPVPIDPHGIVIALEHFARMVSEQSGARVLFTHSPGLRIDDPPLVANLYRIAQEAVTNALRHGGATRVEIRLVSGARGLSLRVRDDGSGMPAVPLKPGGMGLEVMRHRARMIGASFSTGAVAGGGTKIVCRLPCATVPSSSHEKQSRRRSKTNAHPAGG